MRRLAIVSPVYNDWPSFACLIQDIEHCTSDLDVELSVFAVDDGSSDPPLEWDHGRLRGNIARIEVISLRCNMGHQRAIAIGLVEVAARNSFDAVIVMDSDGEDRPDDLPALIRALSLTDHGVVVAHRTVRSEGLAFRVGYRIYKLLFRILTGKTIDFGNYCAMPQATLARLVYSPDIWNTLASALVKSKITTIKVSTRPGVRYAGRSKMNAVALVLHGLGALAVYADIVFVRLLVFSSGILLASLLGLFAVISIRIFTDLAIPGWASSVGSSLLIVIFQALMFTVVSTFIVLNNRSFSSMLPAMDAGKYVRSREVVYEHGQQISL